MPRTRLFVTQTQRLQLNAGLSSAIQMLRTDAAGLTRYLEEQAEANPHLRLNPAPLPGPGDWLPRWSGVIGADGPDRDAEAPAASLMAHVIAAVDRLMTRPRERRIAGALADALEPSGWLGRPLSAIAAELKVSVPEVESVLARLQQIEPAGLFARNLAECLTLQLIEAGQMDAVMQVVVKRLDLLASGDLARLARLAHCTAAEITARFRIIRSLDPKPGTQFATLSAAVAREPDLLARKTAAGAWEVSLNRSCLPTVTILEAERGTPDLAAARAVARLVEARNDTLLRVARVVLTRQRAALEQGAAALVALTMAEVAEAVGLHESTVGRVVAGTAVDTPRGTWWLRKLFSARVGTEGAESSGAAVQARLERLVAQEPRTAPLSDSALALALAQGGVEVARRTVAKYRAALGIPPAHRRRLRRVREKPVVGA